MPGNEQNRKVNFILDCFRWTSVSVSVSVSGGDVKMTFDLPGYEKFPDVVNSESRPQLRLGEVAVVVESAVRVHLEWGWPFTSQLVVTSKLLF